MEETNLLKAVQQADPKAQAQFYQLYKRRMMGICRRYARQSQEAEDIFQEAIIRVFSAIHTVRNPAATEAWVRSVVIHAALRHYRKQISQDLTQSVEASPEPMTNGEEELLARLSEEELVALINRLPDGYRTVFNLYVIDGYSHAEIAHMLAITESTSKSQLTKAKAAIRRQLHLMQTFSHGTC